MRSAIWKSRPLKTAMGNNFDALKGMAATLKEQARKKQEQSEKTEQAQYNYPEKLQAIENFCWNANADAMYPEKSTMTVEESSEYAQIMNQIKTYSDEMMQKFITGLASLDDDWDTYVQQIEALNINRACQIKQDAMERYYAR